MKFFKDIFTGKDGQTYDIGRVAWVIGCISFLIFTAHGVYKTGIFDMANFGLSYSGLLGSGGAALKLKESTEPAGTGS